MKLAYYNEVNPFVAQWLRNLIAPGHIAPGDVDERSIEDVRADDLAGYGQCHFFASLAGWPLALRIARIASAPGIWTGSPHARTTASPQPSVGDALDSQVHEADWPTHGSTSSPRASPRASASRMSLASARGLPRSPVVWDSLATECADPNDRLRTLMRLIYAGVVWIVADRGGQGLPKPRRPEPPAPFCDPRSAPHGNVFVTSAGRTHPVDDGLSSRVGAVHAYGNAIDPWAAAEAIRSLY